MSIRVCHHVYMPGHPQDRQGDYQRLATYVVATRTRRGWSRGDLARAAGISARVLGDVERGRPRGRTGFSPETLALIEHALGWGIGSCMRILAGGDPIAEDATAGVPPEWYRLARNDILAGTMPRHVKDDLIEHLNRLLQENGGNIKN